MKKNYLIAVFFTLILSNLFAQDYCNGDHFYDSGGLNGNYSDNENITTVISDPNGGNVTVTFLSFNLESNFDFLRVFDGPDTNSNLLGVFDGITIPGPFTSTHDSGNLTFVFTSDGSITRSGWDAVAFCESTSCPRPTTIFTTNVAPTSAEVNWTNGNSETQWEIEYGQFGFEHGNGTIIDVNSNPFFLENLEQGSRNDVYIRAICGENAGDDDSSWSNVHTISTPCSIFTTPFLEDFNADSTPACWFEFGSENWNFDTNATFSAANAGDHTFGGNTNYAYIDGSGPTGEGQISNLLTPWIDISNLEVTVIRFHAFSQNNNDQTYNTLDVILHKRNGTETSLLHLQRATENNWENFVFIEYEDFPGINDTEIQIEFIIEENSPGTSFYNDILIDDIIVEEGKIIGLDDNSLEDISIYPNPVKDILTINYQGVINDIRVYDILGKEIIFQKINNSNTTIDFSKFKQGVYFIKAFTDNNITSYKVIKK